MCGIKGSSGSKGFSGVAALYCTPTRLSGAFVCLSPSKIRLRFGGGFAPRALEARVEIFLIGSMRLTPSWFGCQYVPAFRRLFIGTSPSDSHIHSYNSEPNQIENAPISTSASAAPPAHEIVHSLLRCKVFALS